MTKPWPDDDKCIDAEDMIKAVMRIIKRFYEMTPIDRKSIKYTGYDLPSYMLGCSLGAKRFTDKALIEYCNEEDGPEDTFRSALMFLSQLSFENGRRWQRKLDREEYFNPRSTVDMLRLFLDHPMDDTAKVAQFRSLLGPDTCH